MEQPLEPLLGQGPMEQALAGWWASPLSALWWLYIGAGVGG